MRPPEADQLVLDIPKAECFSGIYYVPEVLNVHVSESKKNLLFLERFFSPSTLGTFGIRVVSVENTSLK